MALKNMRLIKPVTLHGLLQNRTAKGRMVGQHLESLLDKLYATSQEKAAAMTSGRDMGETTDLEELIALKGRKPNAN